MLYFYQKKLEIGEQSRIGFHSFIMDSDDHYTIDIESRQVSYNKKKLSLENIIGLPVIHT